LDQDRILIEPLMLDGYAGPARAGVVVDDFDVPNGRIGTSEDLDGPAVGEEKQVLGDGRVRLHLFRQFLRHEMICPGNAETVQQGVGRNSVAEIDDMIDDRGNTGTLGRGNLWIGRRQRYRARGLEPYAVVHLV